MKKGTIFKNNWAGHETYFVYQNNQKPRKGEADIVSGYSIVKIRDGDGWKLGKSQYYRYDIENDREHFPIVGKVNIEAIIKEAIIKEIKTHEAVEALINGT